MNQLALHEFHQGLSARFIELNETEAVEDYGDWAAEHAALRDAAGVLDLSFRSRLCLTGEDRQKFLNGQVSNDVGDLKPGAGCYAMLVSAKAKLQSDLNIYLLPEEILLDFEPGLTEKVTQRLDHYIIADDVQVVDVSPHYGLLSLQGPRADEAAGALGLSVEVPSQPMTFASMSDSTLGEIYVMNHARTGSLGFDFFVPTESLGAVADRLVTAARSLGGALCGWRSLETARIEAGIPRYGIDMDESNLPPETGLESRAISYTKGCYIGQEIVARIRTYGQVAKALRGLRLPDDLAALPRNGDKLYQGTKSAGYITSALASPTFKAHIGLGYVRREMNRVGTELTLKTEAGEAPVRIVNLPFQKEEFGQPYPDRR